MEIRKPHDLSDRKQDNPEPRAKIPAVDRKHEERGIGSVRAGRPDDLDANVLETERIKHCAAFQSSSFASLQAALRAGIAVGLLPNSSVGDGLQVLTKADGFADPDRGLAKVR